MDEKYENKVDYESRMTLLEAVKQVNSMIDQVEKYFSPVKKVESVTKGKRK